MGFFDNWEKPATPPEGRVEALAKVTGSGRYAAEYEAKNLCYGVLVGSTVAAGTLQGLRLDAARQVAGVLDVLSPFNRPQVPGFADEAKIRASRFGLPVFHTDKIYFKGQPIALVVAETLEDATYAASLVTATYRQEAFNIDFLKTHPGVSLAPEGRERGSTVAWQAAPQVIEAEYTIQNEVHNPMEMHATLAEWTEPDKLRLFDKNQGVNNVQRVISGLFGIPAGNIEVIAEFVGGGFGSGLRVWPHVLAAVMAARQVKRPVKVVLTRPQMFTNVGYRPHSWQKIRIGAGADGTLAGIVHEARNGTSMYETYNEGITRVTRLIYRIPNLKTAAATVPLNLSTPTWMRGPGDCTGDFAVESALDELSYRLHMDPVALRLKNISADKHPDTGLPWASNFLPECVEKGAEMIGWNNRRPQPGSLSDGDWKIGYGMAVGMWNAGRGRAAAGLVMHRDGSITLQTAMTDIGTGTGTSMRNIAHECMGIPKHKISIELGNSSLPPAPSQGGSTGLSSISGAVVAVCEALQKKLAGYAATQNAAYASAAAGDIVFSETGISLKNAPNQAIAFADLWAKNQLTTLEVEAESGPGAERQQFAFCSGAAHFYRVRVHEKTGKVKVEKAVCVVDGGRIVSEKAAANQVSGAVAGGIGMALMEEVNLETRLGGLLGDDLAAYHFAVNADTPLVEVGFINKPDPHINPVGSKGLGEVGIIGCAAAIANAIYNATGKRLRDLPITPDKVLLG